MCFKRLCKIFQRHLINCRLPFTMAFLVHQCWTGSNVGMQFKHNSIILLPFISFTWHGVELLFQLILLSLKRFQLITSLANKDKWELLTVYMVEICLTFAHIIIMQPFHKLVSFVVQASVSLRLEVTWEHIHSLTHTYFFCRVYCSLYILRLALFLLW